MRENEGELEQPPVGVATTAIMREGLVRVQPGAPGRCLPAQGGAAVRIAFVRRRRTGIAGCDEEVDPSPDITAFAAIGVEVPTMGSPLLVGLRRLDRKSTRLNSSH